MKSNRFIVMLLTTFFLTASISLVSSESNTQKTAQPLSEDTGWTIDVYTDQEYYYPGESVEIWGWIKYNGTGKKTGYCIDIYDANETFPPFWAICSMTNATGYFEAFSPPLPKEPKGTWRINVAVHPYVETNKTFELVGINVTADANGPYEGTQGENIQFIGNASGGKPIYTWLWDFGDGTTSTEKNATHTYSEPGFYEVTLTVKDKGNYTGNDTTTATIDAAPAALNITQITGGLGISAIVVNEGFSSASNVAWTISLEGGFIILPLEGKKEGMIDEIVAEDQTSISTFTFGVGKTTITARAAETDQDGTELSATAFLIGPFALFIQPI